MKVKVSEASGTVLDWMVAKCEGIKTDIPAWADKPWVRCTDDNGVQFVCPKFSTDWTQGGPIIERERIELCSYSNDGVDTVFTPKANEQGYYSHEEEQVVSVPEVVTWIAWVKYGSYKQDGLTPLIAAMRCFVASKLGDEVEVPNELV